MISFILYLKLLVLKADQNQNALEIAAKRIADPMVM